MLKGTQTGTNNYLVKQLPIATAFLNRKLEVVHASDKWIEYFNFPDRDVFGKKIFTLFKGDHKNWQKVLNDCLKGKTVVNGKERFLDTEQKDRWFEWSNVPWYDERENVIGVIIQTEDVTEKVNDELNLEQQHLLFNEKSEIANIGSWNLDFINQELSWSDSTKRIHELPLDFEPSMETAIDFYKQGHSRNTISMAVERAMTEGVAFRERLQLVTAKGNEKWVIASGKPIFKNDIFLGLLGTLQDINEEVLADIKIKENEQLLKTLIDNLPLNVFIKDLDSKKVLVNKSECDYLGVKNAKELLGKNDFDLYDKEMAQISRDEDLKVINSLTPILGKETISVKKDGSVTTFLTSKIPLVGDDGSANGLIGISLDISQLKQKEEELKDLINVTSIQNKKLINFAHIVSHNLRSHSANFSMLLDFLVNEQNGNERENLTKMLVEASDNLLETLENLNEVVAINTNTNLDKKPTVLNETLAKVESNLAAFLKNNNAKVVNKIADDVVINVIPAYLESILMNFITNGVKYKEPSRNPVITLTAAKTGKYTVVSIRDNGMGIDLKKYGDKLFGMYKTFHNHKDARGIGLYITKNQIEAMNGKVETKSKVGVGTTFNIYFNDEN
ncbi:MAG: PAS domain-containing protein [Flavobacteriaceae bacterium]